MQVLGQFTQPAHRSGTDGDPRHDTVPRGLTGVAAYRRIARHEEVVREDADAAGEITRTREGGDTMAVFYIGTYDIVDPEQFKKYPPLVMALLPKYGGVVLASDTQAFVVEGTGRTMNAIIRFPSKEAALGLYNDPDYQEAKRIRQASTKNISMVLAEEIQAGS
jgi:uncharacterized protein (DUF1330 family)